VQAGLNVDGKLDGFGITENIYRQPRLIDHHLAVSAMLQMVFEFLLRCQLEFAVKVVGDFANYAFAVQFVAPCRK